MFEPTANAHAIYSGSKNSGFVGSAADEDIQTQPSYPENVHAAGVALQQKSDGTKAQAQVSTSQLSFSFFLSFFRFFFLYMSLLTPSTHSNLQDEEDSTSVLDDEEMEEVVQSTQIAVAKPHTNPSPTPEKKEKQMSLETLPREVIFDRISAMTSR